MPVQRSAACAPSARNLNVLVFKVARIGRFCQCIYLWSYHRSFVKRIGAFYNRLSSFEANTIRCLYLINATIKLHTSISRHRRSLRRRLFTNKTIRRRKNLERLGLRNQHQRPSAFSLHIIHPSAANKHAHT